MRATLVSSARRLFVPSQHMWLEASRMQKGVINPHYLFREGAWVVNVGLTDRALDDIGDVLSMDSLLSSSAANNNDMSNDNANEGIVVERGQTMMEIKWDGHAITSADELYHTVWENIEGMTPIQSPVSGLLQKVMIPRKGVGLDEEDVLATIIVTDEQSLENELQGAVDKEKYMKYLAKETLMGAFSEQNNDDNSSSSSFDRQ
eukprot:scaffold2447_cov53-Attheya_sp.AAC.4